MLLRQNNNFLRFDNQFMNINTSYITDGLVLYLDANNSNSYPGTGSIWYDLSGNDYDFTINTTATSYDSQGFFNLNDGGMYYSSKINELSTTCTLIYLMKINDEQSLFLSGTVSGSGSLYVGAYRVGNKFYNGSAGTPTFYVDSVSNPNIYDFVIANTENWFVYEFRNVNLSTWSAYGFSTYTSYTFSNTQIGAILMYSKSLSQQESEQNVSFLKSRL